jgi:isocitrate dehydrogenase kinase/phosphatase
MLNEKIDEYGQMLEKMKEDNKKLDLSISKQKKNDYINQLNDEKINTKLLFENEEILKTTDQDELSPNNCFILHSITSKLDKSNKSVNENENFNEDLNEELNEELNNFVENVNMTNNDKRSLSINSTNN